MTLHDKWSMQATGRVPPSQLHPAVQSSYLQTVGQQWLHSGVSRLHNRDAMTDAFTTSVPW